MDENRYGLTRAQIDKLLKLRFASLITRTVRALDTEEHERLSEEWVNIHSTLVDVIETAREELFDTRKTRAVRIIKE